MLISYTIPCHKRQADLDIALPLVIEAAVQSPPVEIVVVDYSNAPGLRLDVAPPPDSKCWLNVVEYRGFGYYHSAHARNLSIRESSGHYVVISSSDIIPLPGYFAAIRLRLEETGADWLVPDLCYVGMIVCRRQALIDAGGFDERIEFYGSEDKDLNARLCRRKLKSAPFQACEYVTMLRTTNAEKVKNYRLQLTKTEMMQRGKAILVENVKAGTLVANEGVEWGR